MDRKKQYSWYSVKENKMNEDIRHILESVKEYCEDQAIYDKLSSYGDFYYRIVELLDADRAKRVASGQLRIDNK